MMVSAGSWRVAVRVLVAVALACSCFGVGVVLQSGISEHIEKLFSPTGHSINREDIAQWKLQRQQQYRDVHGLLSVKQRVPDVLLPSSASGIPTPEHVGPGRQRQPQPSEQQQQQQQPQLLGVPRRPLTDENAPLLSDAAPQVRDGDLLCRPLRQRNCTCPYACHECGVAPAVGAAGAGYEGDLSQAAVASEPYCIVCRDKAYLHKGLCLTVCPESMVPFGKGLYNRRCILPSQRVEEGLGESMVSEDARRDEANAVVLQGIEPARRSGTNGSSCACSDCVDSACVCNEAGDAHCMMCKNFKYLIHGKCVDSCKPYKGYFSHGVSRFGRSCKPKSEQLGPGGINPGAEAEENADLNQVDGSDGAAGEQFDSARTSSRVARAASPAAGRSQGVVHDVTWGMQAEKDNSGSITVRPGDTVRWTFEGRHSVESGTPSKPDGLFSSGRPGSRDTFEFRFQSAGVFPYFCRSHSGMLLAQITVLALGAGEDSVNDPASMAKYVLTFEGAKPGNKSPRRFDLAMRAEFLVFDEHEVESLDACQVLCTQSRSCKGVYFYLQSRRCKGLSSVAGDGTSTQINADSYTKVYSAQNIRTA